MRALVVAAMLVAASFTSANGAETAAETLKELYAPYMKGAAEGAKVPDLLSPKLYTRRVGKLLAALEKACKNAEEICGPDFDFFVNGQDYEVTDFTATETAADAASATVEVRFKNFTQATTIIFNMKKGDRGWVIDDFVSPPSGDFPGYTLEDVLKPNN